MSADISQLEKTIINEVSYINITCLRGHSTF